MAEAHKAEYEQKESEKFVQQLFLQGSQVDGFPAMRYNKLLEDLRYALNHQASRLHDVGAWREFIESLLEEHGLEVDCAHESYHSRSKTCGAAET